MFTCNVSILGVSIMVETPKFTTSTKITPARGATFGKK